MRIALQWARASSRENYADADSDIPAKRQTEQCLTAAGDLAERGTACTGLPLAAGGGEFYRGAGVCHLADGEHRPRSLRDQRGTTASADGSPGRRSCYAARDPRRSAQDAEPRAEH